MQWENGSATVGEVKRFFRFKKAHYYEKTADGCVEITELQYAEKRGVNLGKDYGQAYNRIDAFAYPDGTRKEGDIRDISSLGDNAGAEILSRHTVGERLRNDTGRSVSSDGRNNNSVSDGIDFSREPETLNELRRQNRELKKRVDYWKGQTQRTKVKTVRQSDVNRLAREVIDMSESDLKPRDITERLSKLGEGYFPEDIINPADQLERIAEEHTSELQSPLQSRMPSSA